MKEKLISNISQCLANLEYPSIEVGIQRPKSPEHGDFASNIALILAKPLGKNPREIAEAIKSELQNSFNDNFESIDIAGPGFINFKLKKSVLSDLLLNILSQDSNYGKSSIGNNKRALVEFVSANPTGPLTVGHGRGAMLGDTVSNILEWNGYDVQREYYFNNAGRQMRVLGQSVHARYLELLGEKAELPEGGYEGKYIYDIAQKVIDEHNNSLVENSEDPIFKNAAEFHIFEDIKSTLSRLGLVFDTFFNENTLYENGEITNVVETLREKKLAYDKEGATWFAGTTVGREVDRVLIKSTGEPTYRLPDIAYHKDKFSRGYDLMVDVFGADHMDAYPDVMAAIDNLGFDSEKVKVLIHQFVTIMRDGNPVKMSTRKANFVTLDELINEVGADVVRYFFIMRGMNSHLNFDLDLAKDQSDENPVFYLQYAHARVCNIIKRGEAFDHPLNPQCDLSLLDKEIEHQLIQKLSELPEIIERAHSSLEPQTVANYLNELAILFHRYYAQEKVVTDDKALTAARLILVEATRIVFLNGLTIMGISAPERM
ncbi:MAG: arginine--tRNA ligase [Candidatus Marinimicrobia bacterium]|nr:arginine--tRNA ligase [Candidatus Neomarinimicrobiota bacterium]MBT5956282.1 arginine--tRNA ligase [Candidatus Neomarinimicrobiota bacterium]MBT6870097.1 arginine--tRNA ligase [Candidatus Neomarinimicrobiota bacterium]MBT7377530.1 arginine--tRNA ligase [Candidatus Neomarinimicrobiota bacterium]